MTRTVLTSIAKTCPACGTTNTVVAATTEIRPIWHMNCSRCGATLGEDRRPGLEAPRGAGWQAPAASGAATPSATATRRRTGAAPRPRRGAFSRCCTGLHMTAGAALGALCTAVLLGIGGGPTTPLRAGGDGAVLAAATRGDRGNDAGAPATAPDRGAPHTVGEWEAAVEAALEQEIARLEAHLRDAGGDGPRLAATSPGAAPADPEAAARAEAALALSRRDRRNLQRRLALAEHDPRLVDGIFGPATRAAIAGWQASAGLPPTGFFDEDAVAMLERQTEKRFSAWQVAAERDRRRRQAASVASRVPAVTTASAGCQRTWSGEIAYGQNVACDLRGLRENVALLFRSADRS